MPPHTGPPPAEPLDGNPWHPFDDRHAFDFAHYHYVQLQDSAPDINKALDLWAAAVLKYGEEIQWSSAKDLYETIDSVKHGGSPWKTYQFRYGGPRPAVGLPPKWMTETYDLCTRDARQVLHHQLATPDFRKEFNYVPYRQFNSSGGRVWSNLMSGDWAWKQAVCPNSYLYSVLIIFWCRI